VYDRDVLDRYPERFNSTEVLLDGHVERGRGDHPALQYRDLSVSYADLVARVGRLGNSLRRLGVRAGDRVVVHSLNEPAAVVANFAVLRLGAVVVPTSPLLGPAQLAHILRDCEPAAAVVTGVFLDTVLEARELAPGLRNVVVFGADRDAVEDRGCHDYETLLAAGEPELTPVPRSRSAVSVLLYQSGLYEPARATAHLQEELLIIPDIFGRRAWKVREDDVIAGAGPICFAGGYSTLLTLPYRFGATSAIIPLGTTPAEMFSVVRRHRATLLAAMPTVYRHMAEVENADPADLRTLRMVSGGGEPLAPSTLAAWRDRFGLDIYEGFGTNGMTHVFITTAVSRSIEPGSMGRPLPGYEVRLLRPDGSDAATGQLGQLYTRGPLGTTYWGHPAAADEVADLQARTVRDGWVRIGDWVRRTPDGNLRFVAREEDLLARDGVEFGPGEVEAVLAAHPGVTEAGVYAETGADGARTVRALVVAADPAAHPGDLPARILRDTAAELGPRRPDDLTVVPRLPSTSFGTVLRRTLWRSWLDDRREEVPAPA
jgi:2-aminobenzoate-CoA ligase